MAAKTFILFHTCVSLISIRAAPMQNHVESIIKKEGLEKLLQWGYLSERDNNIGKSRHPQVIINALKEFQRFANIEQTGIYDDETRTMMVAPRCGVADIVSPEVHTARKKRFAAQGTKWINTKVTWKLENANNDGITQAQVREFMFRSLDKWSKVANIDFVETPNAKNGDAMIRVRFETLTHADLYPFDGPSGTLAHAFFPLKNIGLAGDIHFDDAEKYTILDSPRSSGTIKFLWVAVHELGHSIGLSHSDLRGAVMYPWYLHFPGNDFNLTTDDILGIQSIYGARVATTVTPTTTPSPKTTTVETVVTPNNDLTTTTTPTTVIVKTTTTTTIKPSYCTDQVKAILLGKDKKSYIFNNKRLFISSEKGIEPESVNGNVFSGQQFVDAVFRRGRDNYIIFFHGETFSVYVNISMTMFMSVNIQISSSRKINDGFQGLPTGFKNVDAAFVWPRNNRLYIFKGEDYWRFTQLRSMDYTLDSNYPKKIRNHWNGVPNNIDAVFTWKNNETYFFKGDNYYRFNKRTLRVHSGYPQFTESFLLCQPQSTVIETIKEHNESSAGQNLSVEKCSLYSLLFLLYFNIF